MSLFPCSRDPFYVLARRAGLETLAASPCSVSRKSQLAAQPQGLSQPGSVELAPVAIARAFLICALDSGALSSERDLRRCQPTLPPPRLVPSGFPQYRHCAAEFRGSDEPLDRLTVRCRAAEALATAARDAVVDGQALLVEEVRALGPLSSRSAASLRSVEQSTLTRRFVRSRIYSSLADGCSPWASERKSALRPD